MIFIKMIYFILGIYLTMRMIAALYGILDYWYTIKTVYSRVILRITGWGALIFLFIFLLDNCRQPFLWGMLTYGCIFFAAYFPMKLLLTRDVRLTDTTRQLKQVGTE